MDDQSNRIFLTQLFTQLAYGLPIIIAVIVGMILSFSLRSRSPKAAGFLLIGCLLILVLDLVFPVLSALMVRNLSQNVTARNSLGMFYSAVGILRSILHALGLTLIILAAVADRTTGSLRVGLPPPPMQ